MKLKYTLLLPCLFLLEACEETPIAQQSTKITVDEMVDAKFDNYAESFIDDLWKMEPEWATAVGLHTYDSVLHIPDSALRVLQKDFAVRHLDSLKKFDSDKLSVANQIDFDLIKNHLDQQLWSLDQLKSYEWNPSQYNVPALIAFMLNESYAPLEERMGAILQRVQAIPAYYEAAKQNINNPAPELVQLSIDQSEGGLSVLTKDLVDSLKKLKWTKEEKAAFVTANMQAVGAVQSYVQYLKQVLPTSTRSFRLGKDLYEKAFQYQIQSTYTAQQLYGLAIERKAYLHTEMLQLSKALWPKYYGDAVMPMDSLVLIKKVIDTIAVKHVKPQGFQSAIEQQLPTLVQFVNDKNLLYIDPSKPLVVRKEPAYMAGVAGASISAPGPYDTSGNTYYNVGSLKGWSKEKSESYLREYNHYILQILNIHEAIPGHYTQLVYANKSKSLIKSILANGAMIEGWAVYTEQMMLENGYGDNEKEMWLMWYKWNLRTVCNTILDYSVHVNDMSKDDALHLLMQEAFQEEAEATGKWRRVNVSSVQLTSYFSGYKEIIGLREAIQKRDGAAFDLKAFHETFLSYGNAPVKAIKRMMTKK